MHFSFAILSIKFHRKVESCECNSFYFWYVLLNFFNFVWTIQVQEEKIWKIIVSLTIKKAWSATKQNVRVRHYVLLWHNVASIQYIMREKCFPVFLIQRTSFFLSVNFAKVHIFWSWSSHNSVFCSAAIVPIRLILSVSF